MLLQTKLRTNSYTIGLMCIAASDTHPLAGACCCGSAMAGAAVGAVGLATLACTVTCCCCPLLKGTAAGGGAAASVTCSAGCATSALATCACCCSCFFFNKAANWALEIVACAGWSAAAGAAGSDTGTAVATTAAADAGGLAGGDLGAGGEPARSVVDEDLATALRRSLDGCFCATEPRGSVLLGSAVRWGCFCSRTGPMGFRLPSCSRMRQHNDCIHRKAARSQESHAHATCAARDRLQAFSSTRMLR